MAMHMSDTRDEARAKVEPCFGGGRPVPRLPWSRFVGLLLQHSIEPRPWSRQGPGNG